MKKRLLAAFLSLVMVLGMLPTTALAVEDGAQSPADVTIASRSIWDGDESGKGIETNPWDISYEGSGNDVDAYLVQNNADGDSPTYTCYITGIGKAATYSIDYDRVPPWWDQVNQITKVVVEEGITYIYDDGFSGAELLTKVELPSSLEYLGDYFSECPALTSITFLGGAPGRLWLGARAFQNCTALKEFPFEGVWNVGMYAFQGSGVADVLLPDVEEIATNAFYTRDLRRVWIQSEAIDEVLPGAFSPRYDGSWESIIYVMNDNVADLLTTASGDRNFNPYKTIIANLNGGEFADGHSYADEGTVLPPLNAKDGKTFLGWYIAGTDIKLPDNQAMKDSDGDWYRVEAKWAEDSSTTTDIGDIGLFLEDPGYSATPATEDDIVTVDHVTVTGVQWTVDGDPMDTAAGFQTGESYTITVTVQLENGYTFNGQGYISDGDDDLLTETEMAKMTCTNAGDNTYQLSYTFPDLSNEQTYQIYDKYENVFQYNRLEVEHGNISHSGGPFKAGTQVILTANPEKGYGMDTPPVIRRYTDRSVEVPVTSLGNNKYSFIMPDYVVTVEDPVFVMQTYTITYEGLDGAQYEADKYPATYTIETQPTLPNPTKEGVYFAGWEVNHAGSLGHLAAQGDYKIDDAEDLVLTARWKSSNGLTIHVESFGGSGPVEDVFLSDEVLFEALNEGDYSGSLPDLSAAPELEGYEFLFWHLDYMDFAQYMDECIENREDALANLGEMREAYEGMLSSGNLGGTGPTEEQVRTILDVIGLGEYTWDHVLLLGDAAETSESFGTWYETIQSTGMADYLINKYLYEAEYSGKGLPVWYYPAYARVIYGAELSELTIYATYLKDDSIVDHYQLTYESNGGTAYDVEHYLDGTTATLDKTPMKSGYDFTGWYADSNLTQKVTFLTMDGPKTVYAGWTPQSTDPGTDPGGSTGGGGSSTTTYLITVEDSRHGDVESNRTRAGSGSTVTLTVTPDEGYELDELTVTDASGNAVTVTKVSDTRYTFTMPRSRVTVSATFVAEEPLVFSDVPANAYYADAVYWAVENGVTVGTSATTFGPARALTRAESVTFLWRAYGCPEPETTVNPFTDVSETAYYYKAVLWAMENGVTYGTSATTFTPGRPVTRAEALTFQWRAAGSPEVTGDGFSDVEADAYYADAVTWAVANGITRGTGGNTFTPAGDVSRAQAVTFLYRQLG